MKKVKWFKLALSVLLTTVVINACRKNDIKLMESVQPVESAKSKVSPELWELAQKRSQLEGKSFTVDVNKKLEAYYVDQNGNKINPSDRTTFISACTGFTDAYPTLLSYTQDFDCYLGFKLTWKYQITTDNKIVATNTYNTAIKSKGLIRVYNYGTTTPAYVQTTYTVTIVDLGSDPTYGAGYESYSVLFVSDYIPQSYIDNANAYTLKIGASLAVDCPTSTPGFSIAITDYGFPNYGSGLPCNRNDKVFINPGAGTAGAISVNGVDPVSYCPSGYTYPTWQEVQYQVDGGAWTNISNKTSPYTTAPSPIYHSQYLSRFDFADIPKLAVGTTHTYQFRYRNVIGSDGKHYSTITCTNTAFWTYQTFTVTY